MSWLYTAFWSHLVWRSGEALDYDRKADAAVLEIPFAYPSRLEGENKPGGPAEAHRRTEEGDTGSDCIDETPAAETLDARLGHAEAGAIAGEPGRLLISN